MKLRALCAIVSITLAAAAGAQDESFRFFFDKKGAAEDEVRPSGALSFTNPVIVNSGRIYLYVQYGTNNQDFSGTNLVVDITGSARIVDGRYYNREIYGPLNARRWQVTKNSVYGNSPLDSPTRWWIDSFYSVTDGYRLKNVASLGYPPPGEVDKHFSGYVGGDGSPFGTTLLGYVDVTSTGPGLGEVRLLNGNSGDAGITIGNQDFVYFGFGDAAVKNKRGALNGGPGGPTQIADAVIVSGLTCVACDTNCDGSLNQFDIQPFVEAIRSHHGCSTCAGDTNGDGTVNQFDIQGFVECLGG